jgi:fermentation-respiration switch protein FrsA (DUF1100 family)
VLRVLVLLAVVNAAASLVLWLAADRLIFQPHPAGYTRSPAYLHLSTDGGEEVAALWLPNPAARYTVIYANGNAEDLGDVRPLLERMREEGFSVLAFDYPGYGTSTGRPTEAGAYRAAAAAYAHATRGLGLPPERVILHGRSLGGAVIAELASRVPAAGVVLESTCTSAARVAGMRWLPFDRFVSYRKLARVRAPVLVIHGTEDEVVPFRHGPALLALAQGPADSLWVEGAHHNDLAAAAGERYWEALRAFADGLSPRDAPGADIPGPVSPRPAAAPEGPGEHSR